VRPAVLLTAGLAGLAVLAACSAEADLDPGATEAVFLETCAPGGTEVEQDVCRCAFERITDGMDTDELRDLDRNLRDDPDTVPREITEAALVCAAEPLTPPTPKPTTTTTSTTEPEPSDDETTTTRPEPSDDEPTTTTTEREP
jgi:hypothetical protein